MENTHASKESQEESLPYPVEGFFPLSAWKKILKCSEDTIKRDITAFNIPVRHCGGKTVINVKLWWEAVWSVKGPDK